MVILVIQPMSVDVDLKQHVTTKLNSVNALRDS